MNCSTLLAFIHYSTDGERYCYSGETEVRKTLDQISSAAVSKLDGWKIKISSSRSLTMRSPTTKEYFMNNYASIGADALIALNFHKTRESKFYLLSSRLINRFLYLLYGAKDILKRGCKNLHKKVELYLDDKLTPLPALEAVIILNISSWGGGVKPWNMGTPVKNLPPQRAHHSLLRSQKSQESREQCLENDRIQHTVSRSLEPDYSSEQRLEDDRNRHTASQSLESDGSREQRLEHDRIGHAVSRSLELDDSKEQRLEDDSIQHTVLQTLELSDCGEQRLESDHRHRQKQRKFESEEQHVIHVTELSDRYHES
ncbi:diacylglycerol kinase epsilon [Trichonephila inaurata madagascariensis]|uniref:Diacylglycerol kinase epsilon n=1 Tax=Trichonephila inaurata madagascariensis TaxID=2747483 RepID=A0A8X6WMW9_9ARAC|nr:diacylglycerol kinase epsilon [Trichonephila inaurata madagascariensis]